MTFPLAARAAAWALELVAVPSVNGTPQEAAFAAWLAGRLAAVPAFAGRDHGPQVWTIPIPDDPLGRASVAALVRGRGAATVVLTGHYDTVRVDDYGDLAPLATRPHELRTALLARLERKAETDAERLARSDLASRAFLPGRGLLDMKAGLAAGLAAAEAFGGDATGSVPEGNLLFLAVPDEEASSAGARGAAAALRGIAERHGLVLEAAINLDALVDEGDGSLGRRVALGTVGKLLPSAFVVGRSVHAAEAYRGLNAGALAAAVAGAMEWSQALAERTDGEQGAPPTLLGLKDGRAAYDVTTPERVWAYWNVMTHRRGPAEVLAVFAELCRQATAGAIRALAGRTPAGPALPAEVPVVPFEELQAEVLAARGEATAERLRELAASLAARGLDMPEQCRLLTDHLWTASGRTGPAIVIGFASIPYLPTELRGPEGQRLAAAVERAAHQVGDRHGTTFGTCRYFPGISDMSFLGQVDAEALPVIAANTPAWVHGVGELVAAGLPTVNAGPWGRDYHTPLERLHTGYAFEVLPELVLGIAREVLAGRDVI